MLHLSVHIVDNERFWRLNVVRAHRLGILELLKDVLKERLVILTEARWPDDWRSVDQIQNIARLGGDRLRIIKIDDLDSLDVIQFEHELLALDLKWHRDLFVSGDATTPREVLL